MREATGNDVSATRLPNFEEMKIRRVAIAYYEQDEIIPHLEPGCLPSIIDPDATQEVDKAKTLPQHLVRINARKLAKLDSSEAIEADAKARASLSVLRPLGSRYHLYDADHLSNSNASRDMINYSSTPITTIFSTESLPSIREAIFEVQKEE
ncbi:unnamed protein product, partial [Dovyalis caffra]